MTHALRRPRRRAALRALALPLLLIALPAAPAEAGPPTDALRDFFAAVNVVLDDPLTADQPLAKLRAIRRHVDDVVDFREAAVLALGREWHGRTALEQNEFVALFADLLERSFVWRVAGRASLGDGVRVRYLGETLAGDTASVDTALAGRDGQDFPLQFRMVRRGERWVVRDIVMDGVSTMENYHAQFQRLVRDGSWGDLVAQLRAKVGAPVGVQVAAAAPVAAPPAPSAPAPLPLVPHDLDRPGTDLPHAIAREVAAAVTPAPRDPPAAPAAPPPPVTIKPPATPASPPGRVKPPAAMTSEPPPTATAAPVEAPPQPAIATAAPALRLAAAATASQPVSPAPAAPEPATVTRAATAPAPPAPPSVPAPAAAAVAPVGGAARAVAAVPPPALGDTAAPARPPEPTTAEPARVAAPDAGPVARPARRALWIQVGAFRDAAAAGRVAAQVEGEILVVARPAARGRRAEPLLRVRVGPFPDRAGAAARLRQIRKLGYRPFLAAGD